MTGAPRAAARLLVPVDGPLDADIVVPGSKSNTNRALVAAALAGGTSELSGDLFGDSAHEGLLLRHPVQLQASTTCLSCKATRDIPNKVTREIPDIIKLIQASLLS